MSSNSNTPKPKLACEIAADRVLAGRLSDNGGALETCAARELAPGSVVPDLVENNLRQRDAVRAGIEATLGSVAGRSKDVIAIVPDAAVRVMLVEFDTSAFRHRRGAGRGALPVEEVSAVRRGQGQSFVSRAEIQRWRAGGGGRCAGECAGRLRRRRSGMRDSIRAWCCPRCWRRWGRRMRSGRRWWSRWTRTRPALRS